MSFKYEFGRHPIIERPRETELADILRKIGFKVNRARLTIRPCKELSELDVDERYALDVLKCKYHFLVLPVEECSD